MTAKNIFDFFDESFDYPKVVQLDEILKPGVIYNYVTSAFLNGFINIGGPIVAALLVHRYSAWDEKCSFEFSYQDPPRSLKWTRVGANESLTKREVFDLVTQTEGRLCHTDLSIFRDDVMILTKTERTPNEYLFFWFDCDVSDCCIGRFQTDLPLDQIVAAMVKTGRDTSERYQQHPEDPTPIPLHALTGWMKF